MYRPQPHLPPPPPPAWRAPAGVAALVHALIFVRCAESAAAAAAAALLHYACADRRDAVRRRHVRRCESPDRPAPALHRTGLLYLRLSARARLPSAAKKSARARLDWPLKRAVSARPPARTGNDARTRLRTRSPPVTHRRACIAARRRTRGSSHVRTSARARAQGSRQAAASAASSVTTGSRSRPTSRCLPPGRSTPALAPSDPAPPVHAKSCNAPPARCWRASAAAATLSECV